MIKLRQSDASALTSSTWLHVDNQRIPLERLIKLRRGIYLAATEVIDSQEIARAFEVTSRIVPPKRGPRIPARAGGKVCGWFKEAKAQAGSMRAIEAQVLAFFASCIPPADELGCI